MQNPREQVSRLPVLYQKYLQKLCYPFRNSVKSLIRCCRQQWLDSLDKKKVRKPSPTIVMTAVSATIGIPNMVYSAGGISAGDILFFLLLDKIFLDIA